MRLFYDKRFSCKLLLRQTVILKVSSKTNGYPIRSWSTIDLQILFATKFRGCHFCYWQRNCCSVSKRDRKFNIFRILAAQSYYNQLSKAFTVCKHSNNRTSASSRQVIKRCFLLLFGPCCFFVGAQLSIQFQLLFSVLKSIVHISD